MEIHCSAPNPMAPIGFMYWVYVLGLCIGFKSHPTQWIQQHDIGYWVYVLGLSPTQPNGSNSMTLGIGFMSHPTQSSVIGYWFYVPPNPIRSLGIGFMFHPMQWVSIAMVIAYIGLGAFLSHEPTQSNYWVEPTGHWVGWDINPNPIISIPDIGFIDKPNR